MKRQGSDDPVLTSAEKAVLFLLSLDEEVARPIVAELSVEDLRKLRTVAATMRAVPKGATQVAFADFLDRADRAVAVPRGGIRYLQRLSASALGEERTRAVFEDATTTSPFERLESASADDVAALLANEPPQLAAAILSMLQPASAAEILMAIGPEKQAAILKQVSKITQLPVSVLEDVATALAAALPESGGDAQLVVDGIAKAAELLNASGKTASTTILATLEVDDPDLAATVRSAMFTFEDLERLDARAMRALLRDVPTERLTIALKNAPAGLLESVFRGLSQRAAELIRDDLENMGAVRKAEIEAARKEIVDVALRLDAAGTINLGSEDEG